MNIKITSILIFLVLATSQIKAQSLTNLKEINAIWNTFYKAFDSLDYKKMASIHSKSLIRISGGKQISDYQNCINNYKRSFEKSKEKNLSNRITLRFFERISNDTIASERGVYKLDRFSNNQIIQTFYGQFHVILKKVNHQWKIVMDYDSNEGSSINEEDFNKAFGMNDFNPFISN